MGFTFLHLQHERHAPRSPRTHSHALRQYDLPVRARVLLAPLKATFQRRTRSLPAIAAFLQLMKSSL